MQPITLLRVVRSGNSASTPTRFVIRRRRRVRIADKPRTQPLPATVRLPARDAPILLVAIEARADYLVTGDLEHFGLYFGQTVTGVHILRPRDYLTQRQRT